MTEVNRSNYEQLIPEILDKIKQCTFMAIDAEYTGLSHPSTRNSLFDSAEVRYRKLRTGFANYSICQFGLAIYKRAWDSNTYDMDVYNIYLFPVAFDTFNEDGLAEFQIASLNFLASNNFDFNKFIREGTPFLREADKKPLRKYLKSNRHVLRIMEHRDRAYFPKFISKLEDDDVETIIERLSGFTKVIKGIQESQKPVVGHNMLMDLILLVKQFYQDLPPSYQDFKSLVTQLFPNIFDTKHIAAAIKNDILNLHRRNKDAEFLYDTSLFGLYLNTGKVKDLFTPHVNPINGATVYKRELLDGFDENMETIKDNHCHQAGFDAAATGSVFVRLAHISARRDPDFVVHRTFAPTWSETFGTVQEYRGYVNVVRSQVASINLTGKDPKIQRPNWIQVETDNGKVLDFPFLSNFLPKFGDCDIEKVGEGRFVLACGGWSTARNVWTALEAEGYNLSALEFSDNSNFGFSFLNPVFLGGAGLLAIWSVYLVKRLLV